MPKVANRSPKAGWAPVRSQKEAQFHSKFLETFCINMELYLVFVFHNIMLTLIKKNSFKLGFKELLANMAEI